MKPKRAFTLIELLTVIAVVAVLAAILIPAVSGVRQKANQAKSVSNIKQLYTANVSYFNEKRKFASGNDWLPDGTKTWHERIGGYVGLGDSPVVRNGSSSTRDHSRDESRSA